MCVYVRRVVALIPAESGCILTFSNLFRFIVLIVLFRIVFATLFPLSRVLMFLSCKLVARYSILKPAHTHLGPSYSHRVLGPRPPVVSATLSHVLADIGDIFGEPDVKGGGKGVQHERKRTRGSNGGGLSTA